MDINKSTFLHSLIYSFLSLLILYFLHHLPVNQLFIDSFSEAVKNHDIMDVAFSKFRNHNDTSLFDERLLIINSGKTDRKKIAEVIEIANRNKAKVIGIDLVFDSLHFNHKDTLLSNTLKKYDNIVLGYYFVDEQKDHFLVKSDTFFSNEKAEGYVNLASNDGFTVRAFEPFHEINERKEPSFSVKLASFMDSSIIADEQTHQEMEWINFRRVQPGIQNRRFPINSNGISQYTMLDINSILSDSAYSMNNIFNNKIVLIGFCGEDEEAFSMKDRYFTPLNEQYTGRSLPDMHGVVVHANILSMLLDRDFIHDVSNKIVYLFSFLIFFINFFIFKILLKHRFFFVIPIIRFVQLIQFLALFSLCVMLLISFNIKLGFITIITAVILSFELYEFYIHKLKNYIDLKINNLKARFGELKVEFKRKLRNYYIKKKLRERRLMRQKNSSS